jgi:hypothetical protein
MVMITKFSRNRKLSHRLGLAFLSFVFIFLSLGMIGFLLIEWIGFLKFIF